jgi:hypothetical protein
MSPSPSTYSIFEVRNVVLSIQSLMLRTRLETARFFGVRCSV